MMALNVTINGYVCLEDDSSANSNVYYQMLWYPNGTASSVTTWNDVRICESTGYWSANLGDNTWLTQDGIALSGGKIVVVFWKGTDDRNAACAFLDEWAATEITHDGSAVYSFNTQIKSNISPNLVWSLLDTGLVGQDYTATNSSYDVHTWNFNSVDMYHWYTRYGEIINNINSVITTNYYWGDSSSDLGLSGASNGTHQWDSAGDFDVTIEIEDACGTVVSGTDIIQIKNNAPSPDITCYQAISNVLSTPNTFITFGYIGTDPEDSIVSITWTIEDSGSYGTTDTVVVATRDEVIGHTEGLGTEWYGTAATAGAFTNPGVHTVTAEILWFDGFSNQLITYSEDFTQDLFIGPEVDFEQDPAQAVVGSGIEFSNLSTTTDRVGTGLPSGNKFDWTYYDYSNNYQITDQELSYAFTVTPLVSSGTVTLTANWNDGWENQTTEIEKSIVFATQVTITEEECYYNLNITGTSSDGTVDSYNWEVYKDVDSLWDLIWESPINIEQQDKKICFTSTGDYRIKGFVYGTGAATDAYVDKTIDVICPTEAYYYIWNGTGVDDTNGDWTHSGFGVESQEAKQSGTNGLDASGMQNNSKFEFTRNGAPISTTEYDLLLVYINIRSWESDTDVEITLHNIGASNGDTIYLSSYLNSDRTNEWQKVFISLDDFNMDDDQHGYIDEIRFKSKGNISLYLDNLMIGIGDIITRVVAITEPEVATRELGDRAMQAREVKPSMRTIPQNRSFPGPLNL